jgi:hypothetical protein
LSGLLGWGQYSYDVLEFCENCSQKVRFSLRGGSIRHHGLQKYKFVKKKKKATLETWRERSPQFQKLLHSKIEGDKKNKNK